MSGSLHGLVDGDAGDLPGLVAGVVAGVEHGGGGGQGVHFTGLISPVSSSLLKH